MGTTMTIEEFNNYNKGGDLVFNETIDLDDIDWYEISKKKLTDEFIRKFADYIAWEEIYTGSHNSPNYFTISEELLTELASEGKGDIVWYLESPNVTEKFFRRFMKQILEYDDEIYSPVCDPGIISDESIKEFKDVVCWENISRRRPMTMEFINEMKDQLLINELSRNENVTLSVEFIRDHMDEVEWDYIVNFYDMTPELNEVFELHLEKVRLKEEEEIKKKVEEKALRDKLYDRNKELVNELRTKVVGESLKFCSTMSRKDRYKYIFDNKILALYGLDIDIMLSVNNMTYTEFDQFIDTLRLNSDQLPNPEIEFNTQSLLSFMEQLVMEHNELKTREISTLLLTIQGVL